MSTEDESSKTEKPTEKRKQQFRKDGMVAYSREATTLGALVGGFLGAASSMGASMNAVATFARSTFGDLRSEEFANTAEGFGSTFLTVVLPPALGAFAGALVTGGVQVGWPPLFKLPTLNLGKIFSASSIGQMISPKAIAGRSLLQLAKVALVAWIALRTLRSEYERFMSAPALEADDLLARTFEAIRHLAWSAIYGLALLAAIDYGKTKFSHMKKLKMSKQEIKQEHKEQEGDPRVKGRRRRKMREMAKRSVAKMVPKADVVLVNPTEYAVALRYRAGKDQAPRVLCKGRGLAAQRIRDLARENGIPIVAEPPLTRAIYKVVPEGREIPSALFKAVAEVLAYVYRLRRGRGGAPTNAGRQP